MERVGPYVLEAEIGRGGMAEVFRARAPDGAAVVVKRMLPELAADAQFRAMLADEARGLRSLRHPGIVALLDDGEEGGVPYLVLEPVDGLDLGAVVRRVGALSPGVVARIGADVAAALGHAHGHGVVHRDVTPGNVLVGRDGRARITDFGIARAATSRSVTQHGTVKGKPGYLAPEQALGLEVDGRTDLYALGVTLAEALLGAPLFPGQDAAQAAARLGGRAPSALFAPDLPAKLRAVVVACLQPDPAERPAGASAVESELVECAVDRAAVVAAVERAVAMATGVFSVAAPIATPRTAAAAPRRIRPGASFRAPAVFVLGLSLAGVVGYQAGRADVPPPPRAPREQRTTTPVSVPAPSPLPVSAATTAQPPPAPPPPTKRTKRTGIVRLEDIPRRVDRIFVDDVARKVTADDMEIRLRPGPHRIDLEARDGTKRGRTFDVRAGETIEFDVDDRAGGRRRRRGGRRGW